MGIHYNNIPGLKNVGISIQWTADDVDELVKCKNDPIYFINTYCKIISLDRGIIPFKLYDYQIRFIKAMHENRKVISMQPRQQGKTQTVAAYILWYTLFSQNEKGESKPVSVAILANKGAASREILARYKFMYHGLPMWLQSGVITWNKGDVELENGSKLFTAATSADGIRGKSVNLLYVDEVAIIPNTVAEEFFTSTYPTISSGESTKIILTSTPLGYNHFWKFWTQATDGSNGFIPVLIKYDEHPGRGVEWAAEQKKNLGELRYNQEVMCNFLGSSSTLIDAATIGAMFGLKTVYSKDGLDLYQPPLKAGDYDGDIQVEKDHQYVMVVDTSKGVGGDYSAFVVVDVSKVPYRLVGKFRDNKMAPMLFPTMIHKVAVDYNMAYVLFEINASEQVPHIMYYDLEYENIFFVTRSTRGQTISGGFGGGTMVPGVMMDKKTKRVGCFNIKSIIEEQKLLINDVDIIAELSTFIEVKGSYAADDGYHDDLVMCLVIFGWLTTQPFYKDLIDVDLRKIMYERRMEAIDSEVLPIGTHWTGVEDEKAEVFNF